MALERTYIIPLRREWLKTQRHRRSKKAVTAIKEFLMRHLKQSDPKMIKVGEHLNKEIWKHGIKNPPHKIKVTVIKDDEGVVMAELFGQKYVAKKKYEKKEEPTGITGKIQKAIGTEDKEEKDKAKEEKKEETEKKDKPKEPKKPEEKPAKEAEKKTEKPADKKPAKK